MLVYMIGGLTFLEVAALRFLSRHKDCEFGIVMATTKILNGSSFIAGLMPDFQNNLVKT
ncbi:unnamed protein product [Phaeothamnion confervicola]